MADDPEARLAPPPQRHPAVECAHATAACIQHVACSLPLKAFAACHRSVATPTAAGIRVTLAHFAVVAYLTVVVAVNAVGETKDLYEPWSEPCAIMRTSTRVLPYDASFQCTPRVVAEATSSGTVYIGLATGGLVAYALYVGCLVARPIRDGVDQWGVHCRGWCMGLLRFASLALLASVAMLYLFSPLRERTFGDCPLSDPAFLPPYVGRNVNVTGVVPCPASWSGVGYSTVCANFGLFYLPRKTIPFTCNTVETFDGPTLLCTLGHNFSACGDAASISGAVATVTRSGRWHAIVALAANAIDVIVLALGFCVVSNGV